jgi:flagellin FlaB
MNVRSLKTLCSGFRKDQSGITGLETAIVLIAFVVVAAVFAFTVLTTGLFTSEKAKETALAGVQTTSSSLVIKGSIIAAGMGLPNPAPPADPTARVQYIRVKIASATGVEQVLFNPNDVLITYTDPNNVVLLNYDATAMDNDPATIAACLATSALNVDTWCLRNAGNMNPIIDPGEVMELFINLNELPPASRLGTNTQFTVEIIPQDGAVLKFERRSPLDITAVMNLD